VYLILAHSDAAEQDAARILPMKNTIALSAAIALIVCACASKPPAPSIDDTMKSWLGNPSADLVASWGPPHNTMRDGKGGEIWTYFIDRHWTVPGGAITTTSGNTYTHGTYHGSSIFGGPGYQGNTSMQGNSVTTYQPPQTQGYTARRTFFVNEDGIISRYAWRGR
jgi:hypothetical protein